MKFFKKLTAFDDYLLYKLAKINIILCILINMFKKIPVGIAIGLVAEAEAVKISQT